MSQGRYVWLALDDNGDRHTFTNKYMCVMWFKQHADYGPVLIERFSCYPNNGWGTPVDVTDQILTDIEGN